MNLILLFLAIGLADEPAPLGERVVEFARSKLGQRVGDGQCTSLATEALRHAGANLPGRGQSAWGEERKGLGDARPGDILIFENVVIVQRRPLADGNVVKLTLKSSRHAAIVAEVAGRGREVRLTVLHQNSGFQKTDEDRRKVVQEWDFSPAELKQGTIKAFRPVVSATSR
jgi:hypothetical protein